jgi:hypothetical protein
MGWMNNSILTLGQCAHQYHDGELQERPKLFFFLCECRRFALRKGITDEKMKASVERILDDANFIDLSYVFFNFAHILVVSYLPQLRPGQFGRAYYDLIFVFQKFG